MNCLYLDNFRGFQKTIMPLKDVNFLVGENSTGKTSVLALMNLLASPSFWFGVSDFDHETIKLGNFRDIVSASAKDKSYFRIGLFIGGEAHGSKSCSGYLITFKEKEGMPFVSRSTYMSEGKQVQVKFASKIRYKHEEPFTLSSYCSAEIDNMFITWTKEHEESSGNYTTIKGPTQLFGRALGILNELLIREEGPAPRRRSVTFPWSSFFKNVTMIAPIRTRPKLTYDEYRIEYSPEGEHTPYLIKKYFRKKTEKEEFLEFISKFGEDSGLFKTLDVKNFGRAVTSPFELDIAIDSTLLKIVNVGYGVSQVLPVLVELFEEPKDTCFLIQQPEIHLHPRAQSTLGKLFYGLAKFENKRFFVETHSDFIIDSFRLGYREKIDNRKPEAQIIYFERYEGGNRLYSIEILENGELPEEQPAGYRDFFMKEQMRMLGY